jgi:MFS family permease
MTFVAAMGRIFYVLAPSWEWILLGAVTVGLTNIYGPALNAIVADSVPKERRGMAFSIINLIASVSTTPAPLIAGLLYVQMGLVPSMRLGYGLMMAGFLGAALMRMRLKETVENPTRINLSEMAASYPRSMRESVNVWRLVPRSAFVLFVANSMTSFIIGTYQPVFTLYIIRDLGIGEVAFSYIMTALFVSMIVLAIPSGKIIDKVGKKKPLIAAFLLWAVAVPLFIWGDFWRLILAMSLVGLLQVLVNGAGSALFADLVPKEHRGKVSGSTGFFNMIALAVGQLLGGWMYDNVSHSFPFYLQLALIWAPLLMICLYVKEPERKES